MEKLAEAVDLGELFADRARVRDYPGMRARSRRTVCGRARHGLSVSTGTKKVSQMPESRNRTGTLLPERTTRLPSFHKSWREDLS